MKILNLRVMRGPNYWSNYRKQLIVLKLDLGKYKNKNTAQIENFNQQLKNLLPSLYEHYCSEGTPGGFFQRLEDGTYLGHVVEHVALELQCLADMECTYGRVRESHTQGVYHVVVSYQLENAGIFAVKAALRIVKCLAAGKKYNNLALDLQTLNDIRIEEGLGPSTSAILAEAKERNIPYTQVSAGLFMLSQGCYQKLISPTITHATSFIGVDLVDDKHLTKEVLSDSLVPVPEGILADTRKDFDLAIKKLSFPLVLKPTKGNHGKHVYTNITNKKEARIAFKKIKNYSDQPIVIEKFITGDDYRILLINFKVVAVAKRIPAHVCGDGEKTIQALIEETNKDPKRGENHEKTLTKITIDATTRRILKNKNLTLNSVLPKGEILYVKEVANISAGGSSVDVTDIMHPENHLLAEHIARLVNLDVCGIDVIAKDITQPLNKENNGAVVEVNASPGIRMHLDPTQGKKRAVAKDFVDYLYPQNTPARIPLVAVTGTNGKTTVVRLISHLAALQNFQVGTTTSEGIYINNKLVFAGDCSGPRSAQKILRDPLINFAVLECARGGIIREGLGFDYCNVSILTNISEDHLGQDDIHTLAELRRVKSVVPHSTLKSGYAILNAEDENVYSLKDELACNIAFFAVTENDYIKAHCAKGGLACYTKNEFIVIANNSEIIPIIKIVDVPLTYNGSSKCMLQNVLPAVLTAYINNLPIDNIVNGLKTFYPTADLLPGRLNFFNFENCRVILDFAHNEQAYVFLRDFINGIAAPWKIGIIAGTGDRKASDIQNTGKYAAQMFDEIIIRHDKDSRGRSNAEITDYILKGINSVNKDIKVKIISNEFEALTQIIPACKKDTLIWYFPDKVLPAIDFLNQLTTRISYENTRHLVTDRRR